MKRLAGVAAIALLVGALASCGGGSVTEEEATMAFVYGFGSVFMTSFALAFGQEVEGASIDNETSELTLDGFDLMGFGETVDQEIADDVPYTSVSGTVNQSGEMMIADLTLEGGPVQTLEFEAGSEVFQVEDQLTITVTVNGEEMEITITPDDLQ